MATLYEITGTMADLQALLEDETVDNEMILDTLESMEVLLEEKMEGIAKYLKNLTAEAEMFKAEADRLAQRSKAIQNRVESLKTYAQNCLESAGIDKVKAGMFTVRLQKNPPSIRKTDELAVVPAKYLIPQEPKVDNKQMLADLKAGVEIEGFALETDKKHLRLA